MFRSIQKTGKRIELLGRINKMTGWWTYPRFLTPAFAALRRENQLPVFDASCFPDF
jgi:hypothetical protein